MAIKIHLTTKILILVTLISVTLSFGMGYMIWKLTGATNLAPVVSEAAKDANGNRIGWTCFPGDTKVRMSDGSTKKIEDVRKGDLVMSQSEDGKKSISKVSRIEAPVREHMCQIQFTNGNSLKLTAEHPLSTNYGWKAINPFLTKQENPNLTVSKLNPGDKVNKFDNTLDTVDSIDCWPEEIQTYNLILSSNTHTYFANDYLAHNKRDILFTPNENGDVVFDEDNHFTGVEVELPNGVSVGDVWTDPKDQMITVVSNVFEDANGKLYLNESDCTGGTDERICTVAYGPGEQIPRYGDDGKQYFDALNLPENGETNVDCQGATSNGCGLCDTAPQCADSYSAAACAYYSEFIYKCTDDCDNPPKVNPNICDGGGIVKQYTQLTVGDPITVTGWAYDKTGINTSAIEVFIDNVKVGNATTRSGCPSHASDCKPSYPNVITWEYTFIATKLEHKVFVKWKDIKGKTAANCSAYQVLEQKNMCDGGGILPQSSSMEIGDTVKVTGWAYDSDGINTDKIAVNLDGDFVGNATTESGCPSQASACNPDDPNVINWTYSFTSTSLAHLISASWEDTLGATGPSCEASRTFDLNLTNPDWDMTKVASGQCDESDPNNVIIPVDYKITVTNNSTVTKELSQIVDTFDPKMQSSWVVPTSISPSGGVLDGNTLSWQLTGDQASFDPGESMMFTYTVIIPKSSFGTYLNTVVATPNDSSSSFSASETVIAQCRQPITGLIDSVTFKITIGGILIISALGFTLYDGDNMRFTKRFLSSSKLNRKRNKFEDEL